MFRYVSLYIWIHVHACYFRTLLLQNLHNHPQVFDLLAHRLLIDVLHHQPIRDVQLTQLEYCGAVPALPIIRHNNQLQVVLKALFHSLLPMVAIEEAVMVVGNPLIELLTMQSLNLIRIGQDFLPHLEHCYVLAGEVKSISKYIVTYLMMIPVKCIHIYIDQAVV